MGLFKKKSEFKTKEISSEPPQLPDLPELPPIYGDTFPEGEQLSALPKFKNEGKFSGQEINPEDFSFSEKWAPQDQGKKIFVKENEDSAKPFFEKIKEKTYAEPGENSFEIKKMEPIFVRLDKFEESLHIFRKIKEKSAEIEKVLRQTKNLKEQEEKEIAYLETEIQKIKEQIDKIDRDIFSKI